MTLKRGWRFARFLVWTICATSATYAMAESGTPGDQLLSENRVLLGVVEEVRSDQARIGTGELQPRFIPMGVRKAKGLPDLKKGDLVEITVNDQNLLVDVHMAGESSHHRVVAGQLASPLETGLDKAVIRTPDGKEQSHAVRPVARSKAGSMPVGADLLFLIDEVGVIVDVTFGSKEAAQHSKTLSQTMRPIKGNLAQVSGVIQQPVKNNKIVIRTENGKEESYEVRPLIQKRLGTLVRGDAAVLLVDEEKKVTDVSFIPHQHK
ncbi:MAG: hypothetical protein IT391_16895 [Nitrospira sp.]|nr:hypothetical protein [Nitrospira sp.]